MKTAIYLVPVVFLMLSATAHAAATPTQQIKQSNERIDKILKKRTKPNSPEETAAKTELKEVVNGLIDYRELATRALAQHWSGLSKAQQDQFVSTLRELIEKNYVKQLRSSLEYEVLYKNENLKDSNAVVATIVKVRTKGKSTDTSIDYKMKKAGDRWLVYDMVTDDVSMVQNYRTQFHRIIRDESYDALIKKMRKKIDESDKPKT